MKKSRKSSHLRSSDQQMLEKWRTINQCAIQLAINVLPIDWSINYCSSRCLLSVTNNLITHLTVFSINICLFSGSKLLSLNKKLRNPPGPVRLMFFMRHCGVPASQLQKTKKKEMGLQMTCEPFITALQPLNEKQNLSTGSGGCPQTLTDIVCI